MTTVSPETPTGPQHRVESLDFLRGIAILGVCLVHTNQHFLSGKHALDSIFSFGRFGVQLFFFVSAFTMCFMWTRRAGDPHHVRNFYIRRFFRIAPLFWVAIVVYSLVDHLSLSVWWKPILLSATFLQGFSPRAINAIVPGGWSIAVEMTFYLFFPWLILTIRRRRGVYLGLAAALWVLYMFVLRGAIDHFVTLHQLSANADQTREFLYLIFPNQAPIFLLGIYIYFLVTDDSRPSWGETTLMAAWLIASLFLARHRHDGEFALAAIYLVLAAIVYIVIRKRIAIRALEPLGRNSYAIYLVHFLIIDFLFWLSPVHTGLFALMLALVLVVALSYGISVVTDRLFESKVHRWVNGKTHARRV